MTYLLKASDEAEFKRLHTEAYPRSNAEQAWIDLQEAGIAEKPLEEGWYWVKWRWASNVFMAGRFNGSTWMHGDYNQDAPIVIGPRILPPEGK